MLAVRKVEMEVQRFEVGDVISFTLENGEPVKAMAVKQDGDYMIFTHVDYLAKEYRMNRRNTNEGGFEASELCEKLNGEILELYPEEIRSQMVAFDNGNLLRIPTEKELFGVNEYGEEEPAEVEQWEPMKLRRNRIAFQGDNGAWEWGWLQNKAVASSTHFAYCGSLGYAYCYGASDSLGVRPTFRFVNR